MRFSKELLCWYDKKGRNLPWRKAQGQADPYQVWLSEIMLQQTTVATVKGYFEDFLTRWPTIQGLAAANLDDVLHAWQGLGYYARARNLHKCAQAIVADYGGAFPGTAAELLALPGVGPYTAAAVASIVFDEQITPVDGNVERVISRLFKIEAPLPNTKPEIKIRANELTPPKRAGDFAQALMDLGATVCTPKSPKCDLCPWEESCQANAAGVQGDLPKKSPKKVKPVRAAIVFWAEDDQGRILIQKRPPKGLLGGLMEFPSSEWTVDFDKDAALQVAPLQASWQDAQKSIRHTFTHFHLDLHIYRAKVSTASNLLWVAPENFGDYAFPTLMLKVARV